MINYQAVDLVIVSHVSDTAACVSKAFVGAEVGGDAYLGCTP